MRSGVAPERTHIAEMLGQFRAHIERVIADSHLHATLEVTRRGIESIVTGTSRDLWRLITLLCTVADCSEPQPTE